MLITITLKAVVDEGYDVVETPVCRKGENKKEDSFCNPLFCLGDSCRIQTCNLLIRSQMLYSVELRSHWLVGVFLSPKASAKIHTFFIPTKFFFAIGFGFYSIDLFYRCLQV